MLLKHIAIHSLGGASAGVVFSIAFYLHTFGLIFTMETFMELLQLAFISALILAPTAGTLAGCIYYFNAIRPKLMKRLGL